MLQPATTIRRTKAGKLWLSWVMATRAGMISWGSERKRRNKSTRALSAALFALPNCKLCCPCPTYFVMGAAEGSGQAVSSSKAFLVGTEGSERATGLLHCCWMCCG